MNFEIMGNIVFCDKIYDKTELNNQINYIKTNLVQLEFEENEVMGIALPRTPLLLSTIFSMLQLKIPFMLFDTSLPIERIKNMVDISGIKKIIVSPETIYNFDIMGLYEVNLVNINTKELKVSKVDVLDIDMKIDDIAYMIFTSGSTGKPKAVEVTRRGFINFISSIPKIIDFSGKKRIACFTHFTFDIFLLESVLALHQGLTVILASEEERDNPKKMSELILKYNIQILQMTPSRIQLLHMYDKEFKCLENTEIIMIGGENFSISLLKELQKRTSAKIYNMYGPTETTIWSTISDLTNKEKIDIGDPISNTKIILLDSNLNPVKKGEVGEIVISGDGLARGYRNNEEETRRSFMHLPNDLETKIYRTGDLGQYDNEGKLICKGRTDNQVKLFGHRIELDEIDNILDGLSEVDATVTCYYQTEFKSELITFYIARKEISTEDFQNYLEKKLPNYMISKKFIRVDYFEYTSSGKIDRKAMLRNKSVFIDIKKDISEANTIISDTTKKVVDVIFTVLDDSSLLLDESTKIKQLPINSISYINIMVDLEEIFNIEFEEKYLNLDAFSTVGQVSRYIDKRIEIK